MKKIADWCTYFYKKIFAHSFFYRFNRFLFHCSLHGLGVSNYGDLKDTGELYFLKKMLQGKKSITMFDVGANNGSYAQQIKSLFPTILLHSFEPHPKSFALLNEKASKNSFTAYNFGLGETNGTLKIYDHSDNTGSEHATIYKEVIENLYGEKSLEWDINIRTMDDFLQGSAIKTIDYLKIDTEGNELSVLKGAKNAIQKKQIKVIQLEFNTMNIYSRSFMRDFFELLSSYNIYRLLPQGMIPLQYSPELEIFMYQI